MNDPVLKAFSVDWPFTWPGAPTQQFPAGMTMARARAIMPPLFNLGGRLSPISIRDQMVRGQLLAARYVEQQQVTPDHPEFPVLAIGSGAAGAAFSMCLAALNFRVVLIERENTPFSLQAGAPTRWIDPTHYDWPLSHWIDQTFPLSINVAGARPLPWRADWAPDLANDWRMRLHAFATANRHLDLRYETVATGIRIGARHSPHFPTLWEVALYDRSTRTTTYRLFAAIVSTVGFGLERSHANLPSGSYEGPPFWSADDLGRRYFGVPAANQVNILISGAGDGGLQDFLRIMTRYNSAREIMDHLQIAARRPDICEKIQQAEDPAQRGHAWGAAWHHDHPVLDRLHEHHKHLVETALGDAMIRNNLQTLLAENWRYRTPFKVRLVHSCTHFGNCYPLNRFLTLLIARYIVRVLKEENPIVSERKLHDIVSRHSGNCGSFKNCQGKEHEVVLEEAPTCELKKASACPPPSDWPGSFHVLVIRHGIETPPTPIVPHIDLPRQVMPFDYPQ